jgi:hypothetical protein
MDYGRLIEDGSAGYFGGRPREGVDWGILKGRGEVGCEHEGSEGSERVSTMEGGTEAKRTWMQRGRGVCEDDGGNEGEGGYEDDGGNEGGRRILEME